MTGCFGLVLLRLMRFLRVLINLSDLPLAEDSPAEDRPAVRTFRRLHTIWFPQGRRSDQTQTPLGFCNRGATASVGPGQLFTINTFVRSGEQAKQIPLVFVLMSGKRRRITVQSLRKYWICFRHQFQSAKQRWTSNEPYGPSLGSCCQTLPFKVACFTGLRLYGERYVSFTINLVTKALKELR